jgi:FdhE protein
MFGRKPVRDSSAPDPALADVCEALARLTRLGTERPELAAPSRLYAELLPIIFDDVPAPNRIVSSKDRPNRLVEGVPLFRDQPPQFVELFLNARFGQIINVLSRHRDPLGPQQLARVMVDFGVRLSDTLAGIIANGTDAFTEFLTSRGLDASLGMSVLRLCALPYLAKLVREFEANRAWIGWTRGYCPACGSWPILAEFRGLEHLRWLRCGLCGSGWPVDRLFCPYCESRDHRQLQDLFVDGQQEKYRVSTCDSCRGFVRGISTLQVLTTPGLLVAELETLHLELIARERGFSPAPELGQNLALS